MMFYSIKKKITITLLLIFLSIQCLPEKAWGYDWSAQIKGFVSGQVERSDEIINRNKPKITNTVGKGTGWIAEQSRNGFAYIESKTGLGEENSLYKAAKHYTLHNVGFKLGLVNGSGVVASELYSFVAKLPTAPERLVNFGYAYAENPAHYQAMVKNGTLAVAGTLLNPKPFLTGLYGYGKSVYSEAAKDPLTLGNLHGEAVVYVGSLFLPLPMTKSKAVTTAGKLGTTAKAGTAAKTGTVAKASIFSKAGSLTGATKGFDLSKITGLLLNVKVRTMTFPDKVGAPLFTRVGPIKDIPTLENLLVRQLEFRANSYRKHDPEVAAIMAEVIKNSDLRIRVPGQITLKNILTDGRFKTQLEVHQTRGWYSPETRRELSNYLFGTDLQKTKDWEFEVCGYLGNKDFAGEINSYVKEYGDVIVTLKKENLFERTTFTLGDSLGICARNHYDDWLAICASKLNPIFTACGECKAIEIIKCKVKGKDKITPADLILNPEEHYHYGIPYIEAQYHGGLFASDIKAVTFTGNKPPRLDEELIQLLDKYDIQVKWFNEKTQQPVDLFASRAI